MKNTYTALIFLYHKKVFLLFLFFIIAATQFSVDAKTNQNLRRPISPEQPMWLIHIDTWNWADPQKIIDLIPEDIRPFVVMNISLSINHDETSGKWGVVEYGYETAKSWLRTCAENQMWAMIQPSSGGFCHFSDFDLTVYEEFFREYPNFLGFNYCEQFWGFDDKFSVTYPQRLAHWTNLMKLNQKYGGYLVVSFCGSYWGCSLNPIAMMKRDPNFAAVCKETPENFILCEKYTTNYGFSEIESTCQGAYLSGFSGQYGIRFDECGWVGNTTDEKFPVAAGAIPVMEHLMLTGQTVMDGPELITVQSVRELSTAQTSDGYTMRKWEFYPQFKNISIDIFRKIIDGTVRIMDRKEVVDRTKVVIINNINTGDDVAKYSAPETLFEGLYRVDTDGNYLDNKSWFKKTGRYPTIPTVYQLSDSIANSFQIKVNKSTYTSRWKNVSAKVNELNNIFPQEYTGDLFAGRNENGWMTYNPFKTGQIAKATIPFKYNSCDHMDLSYSQYTLGVIKEFSDKLTFYLTNYDNYYTSLKTDTIKIYGSTIEPTFTYKDRASHQVSTVTKKWTNGVFILSVKHNGALDITVNCSGTSTDRLTTFKTANIIIPKKPSLYTGPRQYEAEHFNYKNISRNYTNGINSGIGNYTGQGFMKFGTGSTANVRDTVTALKTGTYKLKIKYSVSGGNVNNISLNVNGINVATPVFTKTTSESQWNVNVQSINLKAGKNIIILKANKAGSYNINFDNMIIEKDDNGIYNFSNDVATNTASVPAAELITVKSGSAGVISYTNSKNETSNCFKAYSVSETKGTGIANLDLFNPMAINYTIQWKEHYETSGSEKGVLLRGSDENGFCPFADEMKQGYLFVTKNNEDNTVSLKSYIANSSGLMEKTTYTTSFKILQNQPCWYRAIAYGNMLKFECSDDSINWIGGTETTFIDSSFARGSTQLVWGLNSNNHSWIMDNMAYFSGIISVSKLSIDGLKSVQGLTSTSQVFNVVGYSLSENILIEAPEGFEISLKEALDYSSTISLTPSNSYIPSTQIFVRLKSSFVVKTHSGEIRISSNGAKSASVLINGSIVPPSIARIYDFSSDFASTSAKTPPAFNTTIGLGNGATAGVVTFKSSDSISSNMLKPYQGGLRNSTGVINLNAFSRKSTDYSVTWKQCLGAIGSDFKIGMLLRGDTSKVGNASSYYVQGLMQGYLFIVYNVGNARTEFRTYRSSSATSLTMLSNTTVSTLIPGVGQPVWYRASVSGISNIKLILEYSTDSITWLTGTTTTDSNLPTFSSGATQIVWGLGAGNLNFYLDNIAFYGIESAEGITTPLTNVEHDSPFVLSQEIYTISGMRVRNSQDLKGLYIIRNKMSDGTIMSLKVYYK